MNSLNTARPSSEIVSAISREFSARHEDVENDVREFIECLKEAQTDEAIAYKVTCLERSPTLETANQVEEETFRVVIFNRAGTEVLVVSSSARLILPCIRIPHWQRVAENLAFAIDAGFGEQVICLFTPDPRPSAPHRKEIHYQVAEHWRTIRERQLPMKWASVSALSEDSFVDPCDYSVILHSLPQCNAGDRGVSTGPFARLGWFSDESESGSLRQSSHAASVSVRISARSMRVSRSA